MLGAAHLLDYNYLIGILFLLSGGLYCVSSILNPKKEQKLHEKVLSTTELNDLDNELRMLILQGKKIQAIKKYRMLTGVGLKEAKDYVELGTFKK